jgi:hypothetical protein
MKILEVSVRDVGELVEEATKVERSCDNDVQT